MNKTYKLVYSNWVQINNEAVPIANGMHPAVNQWMKNLVETQECNLNKEYYRIDLIERQFQTPNSGIIFKHTNFFYYFKKHYSLENIISENDIVDDDNLVYIYPIEIEGSNIDLIYNSFEFLVDNVKHTYRFADSLSEKMKNYLKTGKVKIVFSQITEPSYSDVTLQNIEKYLRVLGIPGTSVGFVFGNVRNDFRERKLGVGIQATAHATLQQQSEIASRYPIPRSSLGYYCDYVKEADLDATVLRPKKFLCWNRTMNRAHRMATLHLALKHNLLEQGTFSFLHSIPNHPVSEVKTLVDGTDEEIAEFVKIAENMMPYEVDTQTLNDEGRMGFQTNENNKKEIYANSYLHITSETQFDTVSTPFLSEKTFRPILNLQPFIYLGNYKGLEEIRRLGFKTFSPFIDESYDQEPDPKKRFDLIEKEIKKFADMSLQEVHNWYYSLTDILLHNQQVFVDYINYNPLEDFLNTL